LEELIEWPITIITLFCLQWLDRSVRAFRCIFNVSCSCQATATSAFPFSTSSTTARLQISTTTTTTTTTTTALGKPIAGITYISQISLQATFAKDGSSTLVAITGLAQHGWSTSCPTTAMVMKDSADGRIQMITMAASCCGAATCSAVCSMCGKCGNR